VRIAVAASLSALLVSSEAGAQPTTWAEARDPRVHLERVAMEVVEKEMLAERKLRRLPPELAESFASAVDHRGRARQALESVGGTTSPDPLVRLRLAQILQASRRFEDALPLYASVVDPGVLPDVLRVDALADLAIVHARVGSEDAEIEAYESALALEPHASARSTMLANQAEAFMVRGKIARAVAGYRAALAALSSVEAPYLAPTTLWSLGVALDRGGDLDGALESIARARVYDPTDARLRGPTWFFVPPYDEHWYEALGHWLVARKTDDAELRVRAMERSIEHWEEFIVRAPTENPYVSLARARLARARVELDQARRRLPTRPKARTERPAPRPRR
jgi:tetratricopeptide (TPR) repeat protein